MSGIAIQIEHVSKEYRIGAIGGTTLREELHRLADRLFHPRNNPSEDHRKFMALQDVCLQVKKGERLGIIGDNGAGKSTLLKLLTHVTSPTAGTISYNGRIASMLEIGTGFHRELTGRENIYMNGAILGMSRKEIDSKVDDIIEFAEMSKFIDTPVKRYSSGMYVKLAFSVAAHLDSEILIMDEVLAVGDVKFQQKCLGRMNRASMQEGRTVLYVSHNMGTIRQLCSRCVVLSHGRVIFDGDVEKAIAVYAGGGTAGALPQHVPYILPGVRPFRLHTPLRLVCADVRHDGCLLMPEEEALRVDVTIEAEKGVDNLSMLCSLQNGQGMALGRVTADLADIREPGRYLVHLSLPLKGLLAGRYRLQFVIHHRNPLTPELYDATEPSLCFEKLSAQADARSRYLRMATGAFHLGQITPEISPLGT